MKTELISNIHLKKGVLNLIQMTQYIPMRVKHLALAFCSWSLKMEYKKVMVTVFFGFGNSCFCFSKFLSINIMPLRPLLSLSNSL